MLSRDQRQRIHLILKRLRAVQDCVLEASTKSDRVVLRNELMMLHLELDLLLDKEEEHAPA